MASAFVNVFTLINHYIKDMFPFVFFLHLKIWILFHVFCLYVYLCLCECVLVYMHMQCNAMQCIAWKFYSSLQGVSIQISSFFIISYSSPSQTNCKFLLVQTFMSNLFSTLKKGSQYSIITNSKFKMNSSLSPHLVCISRDL